MTGGALETNVDVKSRDELGELADAFNTMTRGLREREGLKLTLALSESLKLRRSAGQAPRPPGRAVSYDEASVLVETRDGST